MKEEQQGDRGVPPEPLQQLRRAVEGWLDRGRPVLLQRWIDGEVDRDGTPRRLPVEDWPVCLVELARARRGREREWPTLVDARVEGLFLQTLRFSRPDGSMVQGPAGPGPAVREALEYWADCLPDPGFKTVLAWWFPGIKARHASPPLPAWSHPERPLAVLRADWSKGGDLVAIDHRAAGPVTRLELMGLGQTWLGPTWTAGAGLSATGRVRPTRWVSNSSADLAEWSFRVGAWRFVRTALVLRGRRLALLADQVDGTTAPREMRVAVRPGVGVIRSGADRSLLLAAGPRRPAPQLIPLGLSDVPTIGEPGSFAAEGAEVCLRHPMGGKRAWIPLLISWDSARNRKGVIWRSLTITENGKICAAETAVAYRVAWGRDESLVVYRSLARPAPRAVLGHQTRARFLVGLFSKEGELDPILTVDE